MNCMSKKSNTYCSRAVSQCRLESHMYKTRTLVLWKGGFAWWAVSPWGMRGNCSIQCYGPPNACKSLVISTGKNIVTSPMYASQASISVRFVEHGEIPSLFDTRNLCFVVNKPQHPQDCNTQISSSQWAPAHQRQQRKAPSANFQTDPPAQLPPPQQPQGQRRVEERRHRRPRI